MTSEQRQVAAQAGYLRTVERLMDENGLSFEAAYAKAEQFKEDRSQSWLTQVIDPLAAKHNATREAVISLLFLDNTAEGPHTKDAFWAEANDFALMTPRTSPPQASATSVADLEFLAWVNRAMMFPTNLDPQLRSLGIDDAARETLVYGLRAQPNRDVLRLYQDYGHTVPEAFQLFLDDCAAHYARAKKARAIGLKG